MTLVISPPHMNQEQTLLLILEKLEKIDTGSVKRDESIAALNRFAGEQMEINVQTLERFERIEAILEKLQMDLSKQADILAGLLREKDISHAALVTLIEEEVINRLDVRNEKSIIYTDYKVKDHEERFEHVPVAA